MGKQQLEISRPFRLGGFATGDYLCNCLTCGGGFVGDKRAMTCLPCSADRLNTARDEGAGTMGRGAVAWIVAWHHKPSDGVKDPGGRSEVIRNNYAAVEARVSNLKALGWVDSITVTPLYAAPVSAPGMDREEGIRGPHEPAALGLNGPSDGEEFLEFKEALSDLRSLRHEYECLNGGGPGWAARNEAAWARVNELFANEDEAAWVRQQEDAHG